MASLLSSLDGSYWRFVEGKSDDDNEVNDEDTWMRVDADGNPADADGNRTDNPLNPFDHGEGDAQVITVDSMIEKMKIKPATTYFTNPMEMGAEFMTDFRESDDTRRALHETSTESYDLAKRLDQERINSEFGVGADGQPNLIRNRDGILVANTEENRQAIEQWESTL